MGRRFFTHPGGQNIYMCIQCRTPFTNKENLISTKYTGRYGKAFLFNKVVNLTYGTAEDRMMTTGRHFVADVYCRGCRVKIGWFYEFAFEPSERYKEGCVILERNLLKLEDSRIDDTCVRVRIPVIPPTSGGNPLEGKTTDKLIITTAPPDAGAIPNMLPTGGIDLQDSSSSESEDSESIASGPLLMSGEAIASMITSGFVAASVAGHSHHHHHHHHHHSHQDTHSHGVGPAAASTPSTTHPTASSHQV